MKYYLTNSWVGGSQQSGEKGISYVSRQFRGDTICREPLTVMRVSTLDNAMPATNRIGPNHPHSLQTQAKVDKETKRCCSHPHTTPYAMHVILPHILFKKRHCYQSTKSDPKSKGCDVENCGVCVIRFARSFCRIVCSSLRYE